MENARARPNPRTQGGRVGQKLVKILDQLDQTKSESSVGNFMMVNSFVISSVKSLLAVSVTFKQF
jgi:hypothetical protein